VTATLAVRAKPGSSRTAVGGRYGDALIVAVTAPAVDGRANEAVIRAVADALGVPARSVSLRSGTAARTKLLAIEDPPSDLAERVARLLGPR
jgi:uncharacterized protein (TIGR00251 family)